MKLEFETEAYEYCTDIKGNIWSLALDCGEGLLLEDMFYDDNHEREPLLEIGKKYRIIIEEIK